MAGSRGVCQVAGRWVPVCQGAWFSCRVTARGVPRIGMVPLYPLPRGPDGLPRVPSREERPLLAPGMAPGVVSAGVRLRLGPELIAGPWCIKRTPGRSQQRAVVYVRGLGVMEKRVIMAIIWVSFSHGD